MITVSKARKLDPNAFKGLDDTEAQQVIDDMYSFAELAFEMWLKEKNNDKR